MQYQTQLEATIKQLQDELHQMHENFREEKEKVNQLEVKFNAYKKQLTQEKKLLRQIIDSSPNLIFINDSDNRFVLANQALAQIYNTSVEEIIGQKNNILEFEKLNTENLQQLEQESTLITQESLILPTQKTHNFQITRFLIKLENSQNCILYVCNDITANKLFEAKEDLWGKEQAKLREMISNFINITSHEFRTPLTTILSSTELLQSYGKDWTEEKITSHLNRIQFSVHHMVLMLDNLLFLEDNI